MLILVQASEASNLTVWWSKELLVSLAHSGSQGAVTW